MGAFSGGYSRRRGVAARPAGRPPRLGSNRERIEAYEGLCKEIGEDPANVALAWLLHQPGVTGPIIGPCRRPDQLEQSVRAVE